MTITGIVKQVGKTQVLSDKFSKRELIVKTERESKYPQYLVIQFTQSKVTLLDNFNVGEVVEININLKGREYQSGNEIKYFNTIEGWAIKKYGEVVQQPAAQTEDPGSLPF